MDACEQILRDLILHEDSWPFAQAVNLREVGRMLFSAKKYTLSMVPTDGTSSYKWAYTFCASRDRPI